MLRELLASTVATTLQNSRTVPVLVARELEKIPSQDPAVLAQQVQALAEPAAVAAAEAALSAVLPTTVQTAVAQAVASAVAAMRADIDQDLVDAIGTAVGDAIAAIPTPTSTLRLIAAYLSNTSSPQLILGQGIAFAEGAVDGCLVVPEAGHWLIFGACKVANPVSNTWVTFNVTLNDQYIETPRATLTCSANTVHPQGDTCVFSAMLNAGDRLYFIPRYASWSGPHTVTSLRLSLYALKIGSSI